MTSNRKTIILEQQNSKKTTVTPNALNEMNHDQMDMVSGSFGVIANNTNLNVFASNFSNGYFIFLIYLTFLLVFNNLRYIIPLV